MCCAMSAVYHPFSRVMYNTSSSMLLSLEKLKGLVSTQCTGCKEMYKQCLRVYYMRPFPAKVGLRVPRGMADVSASFENKFNSDLPK